MKSVDVKFYNTDVLDTKWILRFIQSVPSPKVEVFCTKWHWKKRLG